MPSHCQGRGLITPSSAAPSGRAAELARIFVGDALANPANRAILQRLPALNLPDAWLVAGCLFQATWNRRAGKLASAGVRDYDLFYFDPADLSLAAEDAVARRVQTACADLGVLVEVKNQARVHTWYPSYFGAPYSPLRSACEGIDRFLVDGTCVGLQSASEGADTALTLYAPDGLAGLIDGVLRPNRRCLNPPLYAAKAADYQRRWPALTVLNAVSEPPARSVRLSGWRL